MGVVLTDRQDNENVFLMNFWNWGTIVEIIRRLEILPDETAQNLYHPLSGYGLTHEETQIVADALERETISALRDGERILLDGSTTMEPDDGEFHIKDLSKNYSTTRLALEKFVEYCRSCAGFDL